MGRCDLSDGVNQGVAHCVFHSLEVERWDGEAL